MLPDFEYANTRRITYGDTGASFVPVCKKCGRYVKSDKTVKINEINGLHPGPNCTCSKCGRTRMIFEGFL